jgi:hypothetical protein
MSFLPEKKISGALVTTMVATLLGALGISPAAALSPASVNLGSASSFAVLAITQ